MHWQCFTFWISSRRFIKPREHKNTYPLAWSQDTIKNNWPKLDIVLKALIFIDPKTAPPPPWPRLSTSLYLDCVTLRYRAIAGAWDRTFYSKSDIIFILNDNEIKSSTSILIFSTKCIFCVKLCGCLFKERGGGKMGQNLKSEDLSHFSKAVRRTLFVSMLEWISFIGYSRLLKGTLYPIEHCIKRLNRNIKSCLFTH